MIPNARESFKGFPASAVRSNFNQRYWSADTNQRESIRDKTSPYALTRLVCKAGMSLRLAFDFLTIPAP
jgi:hypothetical protein